MDKISVIVPVWNAERYLETCVRSIQKQTYENLEIILVDDGSSDSSYELCKNYAKEDTRIIVFHKENGGQASARNLALEHATGDFIGFVDNDDWLYPQMYEKLHNYMLEYNANVARCADCSDPNEPPVEQIQLLLTETDEYHKLMYQDIWGGHVTDRLFRREVIGNHRFPSSRTIEDMRFMRLILPNINSEISTNEKLYFYTVREDNTSFVYARSHINSYERALEYQDRYNEALNKYPQYRKLLLAKATTFSCGTLRILWKDKEKHAKEFSDMVRFLKKQRWEILTSSEIGLKYKVFVLLLWRKVE